MTVLNRNRIQLILFIGLLSFCSHSALSAPSGYESLWLPDWLSTEKKTKLLEIITKEPSSEPIPQDDQIVLGYKGQSVERDFGNGFGGIDSIRMQCLKEVSRRYETSGRRPRTLDIGAGLGHMGWKLIVAGADYTGIEGQLKTAQVLQKKLVLAKPFLKPEEKVSEVAKVKQTDFLTFAAKIAENKIPNPDPIEVIWMGEFLHFLSPTQLESTLDFLYSIMAPGAEIFAVADTPSIFSMRYVSWPTTGKFVDSFFENKVKGKEFPGSLIFNIDSKGSILYHTTTTALKQQLNLSNTLVAGFHTSEVNQVGHTFLPGQTYLGYVGETASTLSESFLESKAAPFSAEDTKIVFTSKRKRVFHVFDTDTLRAVFTKHGFTVVEAFYSDKLAKRTEPAPSTPEDFKNDFYKVAIRVRK